MERSWSQQLHSPSKSRPNVFHWSSPKAGVGGLFCLELRASNLYFAVTLRGLTDRASNEDASLNL